MSNYTESKKKIEAIRNKDEAVFRMAISHLMDVGIRHLTEEDVKNTCEAIMQQDDSHSFMTNKYQCEIVKTAGGLAQIDHIHLLNYISKEVYYDVGDDSMSYQRAKDLLYNCIDSLDFNYSPLDELRRIGFEDEEIVELGFKFLLDNEEEE